MTATLMGRLFVVPALVVCIMLGVAVVVILFGASSVENPKSIDDLLSRLQSDLGDKTAGMLLPGAKESWQAAQELARRLERRDEFLKPEEIEPAAERIIRILENSRSLSSGGAEGGSSALRGHSQRLFLITALGRLETSVAVDPLIGLLGDRDAQTRQAALQALAEMREVPERRRALSKIYSLLDDPVASVQMVACLALATLADRDDPVAIRAVARKLESDREVQWNAAMALARLGSPRGKLVLMNMLDRSFWENLDLDYAEEGEQVRRRFAEAEVVQRLCASIEAASRLDDPELRTLVTKLSSEDRSHEVRNVARAALEAMGRDGNGPAAGVGSDGASGPGGDDEVS